MTNSSLESSALRVRSFCLTLCRHSCSYTRTTWSQPGLCRLVEPLDDWLAYPKFAKLYFESLSFRRATHQPNLDTAIPWEISQSKHRKRKPIHRILDENR